MPPPQFDRDAELQAAEVFRSIDLDGDGHLDKDEMRTALAKLHGGQVDEDELDMVMKECDEDGNGVIDELEFGAFAFVHHATCRAAGVHILIILTCGVCK